MEGGYADLLINDKSMINENWDSFTWFSSTGTGGTAPSTSGGLMTLTMDGATGGQTFARTGATTVPTATNTFYTWQFQATEAPGTAAGQVEIYRRESDVDPFSIVGSTEIKQQDFADDVYLGAVAYNPDNTQTQGILVGDYFYMGVAAVPEASSSVLIVVGAGALYLLRLHRRGWRAV